MISNHQCLFCFHDRPDPNLDRVLDENVFSGRNLQCGAPAWFWKYFKNILKILKKIFSPAETCNARAWLKKYLKKKWKSAEHYLARWNIAWMKKICKQYFKKMSRMFEICWNLHRLKFAPILQYYCYYYRKCNKYPKKCERLKIHLKMVSPASTRPISSCSLSRAM